MTDKANLLDKMLARNAGRFECYLVKESAARDWCFGMTYQPATISNDLRNLPQLPSRVTSRRTETLETVSFRSGPAQTVLDQLVSDPRHGVPVKLRANRLALGAATATSKPQGRRAREMNIRHIHRKYLNSRIESDHAALKQRLRHIPGVQTLAAKLSAPSERASSRIVKPG